MYTYGPIIHNEEVTADLERKGVRVIGSLQEAGQLSSGTVIIRSHGVPRSLQEELAATGLTVVDATCPFVKKIHRLVQEYSGRGYYMIIIGSEQHPEVQGIVGWSSDPERTKVVDSEEEAQKLDLDGEKKVCIVAQTTFHYKKFQDLVEIIRKRGYYSKGTVKKDMDFQIHNTICSATKERQEAARALSPSGGCNDRGGRGRAAPTRESFMRSALKIVRILTLYKRKKIWSTLIFRVSTT